MPHASREGRNAAAREWYARNKVRLSSDPERALRKCENNKRYMQRLRAAKPELCRERDRARITFALCTKYGLTIDQFHSMQERQDFLCAICHEEKPLQIDHCHVTQRVRGLLCLNCNTAIGQLKESIDNLMRAWDYLNKTSETRWI